VAQSWAATWHPVIGSSVYIKFVGVHGGRTPNISTGQWTGRIGLTARPTGRPFYTNDATCI
jgi:hypothetical protein